MKKPYIYIIVTFIALYLFSGCTTDSEDPNNEKSFTMEGVQNKSNPLYYDYNFSNESQYYVMVTFPNDDPYGNPFGLVLNQGQTETKSSQFQNREITYTTDKNAQVRYRITQKGYVTFY